MGKPTEHTSRRRRTAVCLGLAALAVLASLAPGLAGPAVGASTSSVTVDAPGAGGQARITVSGTRNLVNQTVTVDWKGFRPSSQPRLNNAGGSVDINTTNPVRVYECRGDSSAAPASPSDCYGSPGFRGVPASGTDPGIPEQLPFTYPGQTDPYNALPDGPANWQDATTAADGTGEVAIQLFTTVESPSLGCDKAVACSLVVVPNYGTDTDQGATEDLMDAPWAWARRTVIPLHFLATDAACPLTGSSLDVEGTPTAARLLASWRAKTCTLAKDEVRLDYTAIGEPQARTDVASANSSVSLVIDPVGASEGREQGIVQAPVAATSLSVAFQIDDAHGRSVQHMELTPRLVAKLITASYRTGGNPATTGNPVNLFHDPDFLALNPGVDWPSGSPGNHLLILGDTSDTTAMVTRWIAADPEARAFMSGKADPWGMTVNSNYRGLTLPFTTFPSLDPLQSDNFEPIQGLDELSRQLSIAQFPGAITTNEGGTNIVTKQPRQNAGSREVIGIIDSASAADFKLATAHLRNAGGKFVAPTNAGVLAGVAHAVASTDGVLSVADQADKDKAIYPLSMLVTAAMATKASLADRTAMAAFLSYAAGAGQVRGDGAGRLPGGYVPLPKSAVARILAVRTQVLAGYKAPAAGSSSSSSAGGSAGGSSSASSGAGTGDVGTTASSDGTSAAGSGKTTATAAGPAGQNLGLTTAMTKVSATPLLRRNIYLPLLLGLGLLLMLAGPTVLLLQSGAVRRASPREWWTVARARMGGFAWRRK